MTRRFLPVSVLGIGLLVAMSLSGSASVQIERSFNFSYARASFFQDWSSNAYVAVSSGDTFAGVGTFLSVYLTTPDGFFSGCFKIPDADFSHSGATATLNTTVSRSNPGCSYLFGAVPSSVAGQLASLDPSALGGGGGSPPFPPPQLTSVTMHLTWAANGPENVNVSTYSQSCADNEFSSSNSESTFRAAGSGTITGFSGTVSSSAYPFGTTIGRSSIRSQLASVGPIDGCFFYYY